jgi:hypothetical protein
MDYSRLSRRSSAVIIGQVRENRAKIGHVAMGRHGGGLLAARKGMDSSQKLPVRTLTSTSQDWR